MRRLAIFCLAVSMSGLLAPAGQAPAATSSARTRVPIGGVGDVLFDHKNRHIFVSGGVGTRKVVALNLRGRVVKVFRKLPDPGGMVRRGNRVYVLVRGAKSIQVINSKKLRRVGRHRVGAIANPLHLAKSGGRLWFWKGECNDRRLKSLDLRTGNQRSYRISRLPLCPRLVAGPGLRGRIIAWIPDDPSEAYKLDVRGGPPVIRVVKQPLGEPDVKAQLVLHPNGRSFFAASWREHERFGVADLSKMARYPVSLTPVALDVARTKRGVMIGSTHSSLVSSPRRTEVDVWKVRRNPRLAKHVLGGRYSLPYPRGIVLHPSGRRAFVFTGALTSRTYMHVVRF